MMVHVMCFDVVLEMNYLFLLRSRRCPRQNMSQNIKWHFPSVITIFDGEWRRGPRAETETYIHQRSDRKSVV